MTYRITTISSPVGPLKLVANETGLTAVLWENDPPGRVPLGELTDDGDHPVLLHARRELKEYFAGRRRSFTVPLAPAGTHFQKTVWAALLTIPYGETRSYGELARQVGNPKAARAVGAANAKNPLSIITPCHRAIGSNGTLTGFAGGLAAKRFLLTLEATACGLESLPIFAESN
ncbi:MAG: methylated-DNA--[protein]-cysteine S-methyltransferase [Beijerinckiaceae bacterium]|nr:MAG: methylated-DNA--[protein]-cysteine S-methyltransferase [Beijerinckiaceae bacterium]